MIFIAYLINHQDLSISLENKNVLYLLYIQYPPPPPSLRYACFHQIWNAVSSIYWSIFVLPKMVKSWTWITMEGGPA